MPTIEERVAYLEGQVGEHSHRLMEIRDSIRQFERRVDTRFDQVDRHFEQLERRLEARFDVVDRRFEVMDEKVARHFTWLVGIQVTTLVAIVGALLARP